LRCTRQPGKSPIQPTQSYREKEPLIISLKQRSQSPRRNHGGGEKRKFALGGKPDLVEGGIYGCDAKQNNPSRFGERKTGNTRIKHRLRGEGKEETEGTTHPPYCPGGDHREKVLTKCVGRKKGWKCDLLHEDDMLKTSTNKRQPACPGSGGQLSGSVKEAGNGPKEPSKQKTFPA